MTTTTVVVRLAAASRPVLAAAALLAAVATPAVAQGPPAGAPPPNARFDTNPVRLDVNNLNLPPGFGVGVEPGRPAGGLPVAGDRWSSCRPTRHPPRACCPAPA